MYILVFFSRTQCLIPCNKYMDITQVLLLFKTFKELEILENFLII